HPLPPARAKIKAFSCQRKSLELLSSNVERAKLGRKLLHTSVVWRSARVCVVLSVTGPFHVICGEQSLVDKRPWTLIEHFLVFLLIYTFPADACFSRRLVESVGALPSDLRGGQMCSRH
ncbi:unnamed protein product, partial [Ascophyllum nodosum]